MEYFNSKDLQYIIKNFKKSWKFKFRLFSILPMGYLSGMKIKKLDEKACHVEVPYKWLNKNPFKSTFWAVLGMAAEMSSGALVLVYTYNQNPSISMLVSKTEGIFLKKATGKTTFVCEDGEKVKNAIIKTIQTGEGVEFETNMNGYNTNHEKIAQFKFTWSVKKRST